MIFQQWREILENKKTQTRRIADRYKVGSILSVTPKMYKHAIWWKTSEDFIESPVRKEKDSKGVLHIADSRPLISLCGYQQMKVRIVAKRRELLQDITESDAIAEGVASVKEYATLWDSINKKGPYWKDNPTVTVYTFELVKE